MIEHNWKPLVNPVFTIVNIVHGIFKIHLYKREKINVTDVVADASSACYVDVESLWG